MSRLFVTDSGAVERQVTKLFAVDSGGTARQIMRLFVIDSGGTARLVFVGATYALPSGDAAQNDDVGAGGFAQTTISFTNTGLYSVDGANLGTFESGNWITPTSIAPGAYTIRAHVSSGGVPNGSALDTDVALSTSPGWYVSTVGGTVLSTLLLTLKDGSGNTVATSTVSIRADA